MSQTPSKSYSDPDNLVRRKMKERMLELRIMGLTLRDILDQIRKEFGEYVPPYWDERNLSRAIKSMIAESEANIGEAVAYLKNIDSERLERMFMVAYNNAISGDLKSMAICLKIMDQRARMFGLYAPSQVQVSDWRSEIIQLLKQKKITYDQLVTEVGIDLAREIVESAGTPKLESGEGQETEGELVGTGSADSEDPDEMA